jgi:hypothetical protein
LALAPGVAAALSGTPISFAQADPLPSWNDGAVKKAITAFIVRVSANGASDFVPAPERIAVFDNDGTLWCERPVYFQVAFAAARSTIHRQAFGSGAAPPTHPRLWA